MIKIILISTALKVHKFKAIGIIKVTKLHYLITILHVRYMQCSSYHAVVINLHLYYSVLQCVCMVSGTYAHTHSVITAAWYEPNSTVCAYKVLHWDTR